MLKLTQWVCSMWHIPFLVYIILLHQILNLLNFFRITSLSEVSHHHQGTHLLILSLYLVIIVYRMQHIHHHLLSHPMIENLTLLFHYLDRLQYLLFLEIWFFLSCLINFQTGICRHRHFGNLPLGLNWPGFICNSCCRCLSISVAFSNPTCHLAFFIFNNSFNN